MAWTTGVQFPEEAWVFFLVTASRSALGTTPPHNLLATRALYAVVKQPGREADNSPPSTSSAEVKNS
jgi:hypothetical protein